MGELTFKGLKVDELDLTNKIEGQVELDISQRASFNVKYSNDNLHCMANLTIDMMEKLWSDKNNQKMYVPTFINNYSTDKVR